MDWSPSEVARYDQYVAGADEQLTALMALLKRRIAEAGEPTAMAELIVTLVEKTDPVSMLGLTAAALRRLAVGHSQPLS